MTSALPPGGRRDNGLPSAEWGALVDLDPRLSAALLDSLAAEGVAAYVEPARDVDSFTRASVLPSRPLDRLWVDPSRADLARGVVTSEVADLTALLAEQEPGATAFGLVRPVPRSAAVRVLPPPELPGAQSPEAQSPGTESPGAQSPGAQSPGAQSPGAQSSGAEGVPEPTATSPDVPPVGGAATPSDEELFQQIIAGYSQDVSDPVPRWPVSEDVDGPPAAAPSAASLRRRRGDTRPPDDEEQETGLPDWVEPARLEDEGHYEPPPPPKVPRPRLRTLLVVAMIVLGVVVLFAPFRIGLDDSPVAMLFGLLLTGGGGALLVASMRDAPPTDSGPDDGAVV